MFWGPRQRSQADGPSAPEYRKFMNFYQQSGSNMQSVCRQTWSYRDSAAVALRRYGCEGRPWHGSQIRSHSMLVVISGEGSSRTRGIYVKKDARGITSSLVPLSFREETMTEPAG